MILCLTPNPAIDRTILLPSLTLGQVHRAQKTIVAAGGKGMNVARTIRALGGEPLCMGFAGGHSGRLLAGLAQKEGLQSEWTWTGTETRTCTILVSPTNDATVINEAGATVPAEDWNQLQRDIRQRLPSLSSACISGSLPPHSSAADFQDILRLLVNSGKQTWVDTSGMALRSALDFPEICIKVNGSEIAQVLGVDVRDLPAAKQALTLLGQRGIHTSVITLGSEGALLSTKEGNWHAQGPQVAIVSTVGSGDSFLGGLVRAVDAGRGWPDGLRDAVAAGTANALSAGGGQFRLGDFHEIRQHVQITEW